MIKFIRGKYGAGLKEVVKRLQEEHGIPAEVVNIKKNPDADLNADMVVCWGVTHPSPQSADFQILFNPPEDVKWLSNKGEFLRSCRNNDIPCVPFTFTSDTFPSWEEDAIIYARHSLSGSGGKGITVIMPGDEIPDAPLYTKRVRGREYRVHLDVYSGQIIDVAQKRKMTSEKLEAKGYTYNKYVKSHKNGWVHSHVDIIPLPHGIPEKIIKDFED